MDNDEIAEDEKVKRIFKLPPSFSCLSRTEELTLAEESARILLSSELSLRDSSVETLSYSSTVVLCVHRSVLIIMI